MYKLFIHVCIVNSLQTYVGDILIAIDPFKELPIYDKKVIYLVIILASYT